MEGDGSRVTFLACSWVPREDEEPGKETEKVGPPPPSPRPWGLEEQLPALTAPQSPGWGRLNPSGAGIRESREQRGCAHMFLWVWPKCCVPHRWGLPLAALLNSLTLES